MVLRLHCSQACDEVEHHSRKAQWEKPSDLVLPVRKHSGQAEECLGTRYTCQRHVPGHGPYLNPVVKSRADWRGYSAHKPITPNSATCWEPRFHHYEPLVGHFIPKQWHFVWINSGWWLKPINFSYTLVMHEVHPETTETAYESPRKVENCLFKWVTWFAFFD